MVEDSKDLRRLFAKFLVGDGCWTWTASKATKGYGHIKWEGRLQPAHRVVYRVFIGPIPEGLTLDHLCRNRACVNPAHLEPVTIVENIARRPFKTHCKRGHAFDEENTYHFGPDKKWRLCRACVRLKYAERDSRLPSGSGL